MPRIFQAVDLQENAEINLDERASHYLRHVLRSKVGDEITLFNGHGGEFRAQILSVTKKELRVLVQIFNDKEVESLLKLTLAQGIARGEKMDFIIQKAVELGVTKIIPVLSERCNVRLDRQREEKRHLHWQAVIVSACEQSGRNRVPELAKITEFTSLLRETQGCKIMLSPHTQSTLNPSEKPGQATLFVGPEGGFDAKEMSSAEQAGAQFLNLGPRVLRTETAGLASLSILQALWGDMLNG